MNILTIFLLWIQTKYHENWNINYYDNKYAITIFLEISSEFCYHHLALFLHKEAGVCPPYHSTPSIQPSTNIVWKINNNSSNKDTIRARWEISRFLRRCIIAQPLNPVGSVGYVWPTIKSWLLCWLCMSNFHFLW